MSDDRPVWDHDRADALVGAVVLIGMTYDEPAGPRYEQVFGVIEMAAADRGVSVRLEGTRAGELFWLPPDLDAFQKAKPGEYRLKATGEVVVDPDYISSWTLTPPTN